MARRIRIFAILLAFPASISCEDASNVACDFAGQCTSGKRMLDLIYPVVGSRECQFLCATSGDCAYYSYYVREKECWLLSACDDVSCEAATPVEECASLYAFGAAECFEEGPKELVCGEALPCEGPTLAREEDCLDVDDCQNFCLETPGCRYISHKFSSVRKI